MIDNLEPMRIVLRRYRKPGESVDQLIERIVNDTTAMTTLVNLNPNMSNAGLIKALITDEDFKRSL